MYQEGDLPATSYFPSAVFQSIPHVGHFANIEDPATFSKIVVQFVKNREVDETIIRPTKNKEHDEL